MGEVTLNRRPIPKVDKFKYLGSIIQQHGNIDEDIFLFFFVSNQEVY